MTLPYQLPPIVFPPPFDDAAAARLAAALDRVADAVRSMATRESDRANTTVRDWHGFTRRWFDAQHRHAVQTLAAVAGAATAEATSVRQAAFAAATARAAAQAAYVAQQQFLADQQALLGQQQAAAATGGS